MHLEWKRSVDLQLCVFANNEIKAFISGIVDFKIERTDGNFTCLTGHTVTQISKGCHIRAIPMNPNDRAIVRSVCKRKEISEKERIIDLELLIGNDYYWYFLNPTEPIELQKSGCRLLSTKIGWVTSGFIKSNSDNLPTVNLFCKSVPLS